MEIPGPAFELGQKVKVILNERNHTPHRGVIIRIIWHHKNNCHYYYIQENNKRISKRYSEEDLQYC